MHGVYRAGRRAIIVARGGRGQPGKGGLPQGHSLYVAVIVLLHADHIGHVRGRVGVVQDIIEVRVETLVVLARMCIWVYDWDNPFRI